MSTELAKVDARLAAVEATINALNSENSKRAYERHLLAFLHWHNEQGRPGLTKSIIGAYKAHLQASKGTATVNQALAAIKKMIAEAADNGMVDPIHANGIANVRGVKSESLPAGRSLARGELSALLAACANDQSSAGVRDGAIIAVLYAAGLRRAELVSLDYQDFNPDSGELRILHAKGNKQRLAHLVNGAKAAMLDWLTIRGDAPGPLFVPIRKGGHIWPGRLTTQAVYHVLQNRAQQAGVRDISPHDFRRSFVGDLLDAGADISTVQQMAGHADISTTQRYDRRPEEARRKAAELLHVPYQRRVLRYPT